MTTPVSNINRTNLNALDPNLATGQVADPALRKAVFDEVYNYFDTFVAAYNAFIANGGVVTANIGDLAVTTAKIALGAVTAAQMASTAIGTGQLADSAVTSVKIADDTIVNADINSAAAISWSKISKSLSSLADLATRSATDLNSGTLNVARLPAAIPATNIGNGDVTNAILSFLNTLTSNAQTQLDAKVPLAQKGVANGVASLDSGAKVPIAQLPDAVLGALEYQGTWNASTNTPTLTSTPTTIKGYYYVVSAAGTQFSLTFDVGDWIVSNGSVWQKVDNTDAVTNFNGRLGAIVPTTGDYTWGQINKTVSSLLDLATRSASDLSSGTLPDARRGARTGDVTSPSGSGVNTIAANAVTTAKIADLNVTTVKLADANVTTGKLADLAVTTAKINDLGITTGKIVDGAVTAAKLDPSINVAGIPLATHIASNPIDHPDGSVTNVKIAAGIDAVKLADGSVTNAKLQYINSLTTNVQTQISQMGINVKSAPYNAVGDGVTDDTAAFLNAIAYLKSAGGGILFLPKGTFKIKQTLVIDFSLSIYGSGSDYSDLDSQPRLTKSVSALLWGGNNSTPFIQVLGRVGGMEWKDFIIDGGRVATDVSNACTIGLDLDRVVYSRFSNMIIENCKTNCLRIVPRGVAANDNTMHNVFSGIQLLRADVPFNIDGTGISNVCHNVFQSILSDYYTTGFYLGDCDNNCFQMLRTYPRAGTGYGLYLKDNTTRANYFYHVQLNGCYAGANSKNAIFGYDKENGQADPTIVAGAKLFFTENGNNASFWNMTELIRGITNYLDGEGVSNDFSIQTTAQKLIRGSTGQVFGLELQDVGRSLNFWLGNGSGTFNKVMSFSAYGKVSYKIDSIGASQTVTYGAAMPSSGAYALGDMVLNINRVEQGAASSKYIIYGWDRLTTGSSHVLNTDWRQMRMLTGN